MTRTPRFGLGFRTQHFAALAEQPRCVDWLELLSENYLGVGGPRRARLEKLRADHVVALHGVSLGIANDLPPREDYLAALRELADFVAPAFLSDHLCWTGFAGRNSHDLLPIAHSREVLAFVCERVERVQEALGRRLLLENATAYVAFRTDEMSEAEFWGALCQRSGCGMLLDVNNLYVNAKNLGVDPTRALDALRPEHVGYLHIAGHAVLADVRIDTHGAAVPSEVWSLYADVVRRFPEAHVMLERDDAIPPLAGLLRELEQARAIWHATNAGAQRAQAAARPDFARPDATRATRASVGEAAGTAISAPPRWVAQQRDFWQRCVDRPLRFDHAAKPGLGALLDSARPVTAARGLRVYSDAYTANLRSALAANFPALARVLDPRDFSALAASYAASHPSTSHDYASFGARLADFVRDFAFANDYGVANQALADLARLEQAQLEVQEARDDVLGVSPEALTTIPPDAWERAQFRFTQAYRVVFASYDVLPAVRAVARDEAPERPQRSRLAYLITRRDGALSSDPIATNAACALAALADGASFAEACAKAGGEDAVEPAIAALGLACARGAVLEIIGAPQPGR